MASVFEGKRVLLTGASDGIGAAVARALGAEGARVGLFARRKEKLEEVAAAVHEAGGEALVLPGDVTSTEEVEGAFATLVEAWGGVDIAIANAGVGLPDKLKAPNTERMLRTIEVNVGGVIRTVNAALPRMLEQGSGHIVGISSPAGRRGLPGSGSYSASKAAVSRLLESIRGPARARGVYVTAVNPGFVKTPMTAKNKQPMPFVIEADEAARHVLRAIRLRRREYTFPWQMATLIGFVGALPNALFDQLARKMSADS